MLGLLISELEQREIEYMVKRELDELWMDLRDTRIDSSVKKAMKERYYHLFQLLRRIGNREDCIKYMPRHIEKR